MARHEPPFDLKIRNEKIILKAAVKSLKYQVYMFTYMCFWERI